MTKLITIEDFAKLDLRVAKIENAERVEGTSKLVRLEVSLGDERRTIVAGIARDYACEELIGKKIIILANLQPKEIRGVKSEGMLLAAEADGKIALLTVDKDIKEGARVR